MQQFPFFFRRKNDPDPTRETATAPQGGCDRHPSFGWKHADGKARRCAHHRLEGMESVKVNNRRGGAAKNALKANQAR